MFLHAAGEVEDARVIKEERQGAAGKEETGRGDEWSRREVDRNGSALRVSIQVDAKP
jgi:hypothetical protein